MSFFKSLEQLWIKIQQKNIVLVSGNVDEIIPINMNQYKNLITGNDNSSKDLSFIDLNTFLYRKTKEFLTENKSFYVFSPINGQISFDNGQISFDEENGECNQQNNELSSENKKNDDPFSDLDTDSSNLSLDEYIDLISNNINLVKKNKQTSKTAIFVINFVDILLNEKNSNLASLKLSQLLENFVSFDNEVKSTKFRNDNFKLIIVCRNPQVVNSLITNNIEFSSVNLAKPSKEA